MNLVTLPILSAVLAVGLASLAFAAGNGAGAGGAGHQRAINSGLPAGDPGPAGAPNNPHHSSNTELTGAHGSPRTESVAK